MGLGLATQTDDIIRVSGGSGFDLDPVQICGNTGGSGDGQTVDEITTDRAGRSTGLQIDPGNVSRETGIAVG